VTPSVVLTIAGSDSGGGAGIQADLKTFAALGLFGTSAITAVTAQHTAAVLGVVALEPEFVVAQVEAVVSDLHPKAAKTGMLATPETVRRVAELVESGRLGPVVVDPVLVSSTGHALMGEGGVDAYRRLLLPQAAVATPNLREAALLTGRSVEDLMALEQMFDVADELRSFGSAAVVVKGGHVGGDASPDVFVDAGQRVVLPAARVVTANDHGTGCSLSAAIAAGLALGSSPLDAVRDAKAFVHRALSGAAGWRLGAGHGPIDHFGWGDGHRSGSPAGEP
jgi:hydroxymethylpyrimidine/phosphomethylpyrimidine kinase